MAPQRRTARRDDRVTCPVCGVRVRKDNLDGHMDRTHPEGEATDANRQAMLRRKMDARRSATLATLRTAVPVVVVALLLIVISYFAFIYEAPPEKPPDWKLQDIDGLETYYSNDYFKEGLTLVEFMHTKCPNCKDMAPILGDIFDQYQGNLSGMFTIGGYMLHDTVDSPTTLREFRDEHGSKWVHLYDPDGKLMRDYGTNSYPSIYFIKDDRIVYTQVGKTSYSFIESLIQKYS